MEKKDHADPPTVSRRDFLKGASVTLAGVGLAGTVTSISTGTLSPDTIPVVGPNSVRLSFTLNGKKREVEAEPWTTLLDLVRDRMDLTGTKRVCDRGACGACSMLVEGKLVNSCSYLAIDASGKEVKTIEGLSEGGLTRLQKAFIDCDALQCGFCTPGMVVALTALLEKTPHPTREEIASGIAGNICRCGTYQNIFEAVLRASGKESRRARI